MTLKSQQRTTKTEASAENGMVTAMHPLAAEAGIEILKRGGNAVDAAIATALASGVVEPFMSGLGGTLYALVYDESSGDTRSFDGTATAPGESRDDMYELASSDDAPTLLMESHFGDAAAAGLREKGHDVIDVDLLTSSATA